MANPSNYTVGYEGWLTVTASSEEEALELAYAQIAKGEIPNDDIKGYWEFNDVEIADEEF